MRQILLQVPEGGGAALAREAEGFGASTLVRLGGTDGDGQPVDVLVLTVPNGSVGDVIDRAQELGPVEASVPGVGVFAFEPPAGEPPDELTDVTARSGYEVVLAGQQAAGSWTGFLSYSSVAGIVVWLGLYTEMMYLLTAAMLIAPFAGPAMNTAISLASGRPRTLRHSVLRYAAGIGVTAAAAAVLTLFSGPDPVTSMMAQVLTLTWASFLLPLSAGVAGASYLVQSEHSSLISGAAVGLLVAASLAPPAGGLGIAVVLLRFDLVLHAVFLIALQLAGITLSATAVLWLYGIRPGGQRFSPDRRRPLAVGLGLAALVTGGLVVLQLLTSPLLNQGTLAHDVSTAVKTQLADHQDVRLLAVESRVASADVPGPPRILVEIDAEQTTGVAASQDLLASLTAELTAALQRAVPDAVPRVELNLYEPASGS